MNFYPFHIGDYISHTRHLSDKEDLSYRRMIDLYYQNEVPFVDEKTVARKIKSTPKIVLLLLEEFFVLENDGWHNKRADEEINKYKAKADSARKANDIRWHKKSDLKSDADQILTKNHEPITKNHIISVAKATKAKRLEKDFLLPTEWIDFCKAERKDLNPISVFAQFKDYWIAQGGQKGTKLDWFATWRNWVRNTKSTVTKISTNESKNRQSLSTAKWFDTYSGVVEKGKELGIDGSDCQNISEYEAKIRKVIG
jgi:uncharacterized protein YdaU (DUF1376 family)